MIFTSPPFGYLAYINLEKCALIVVFYELFYANILEAFAKLIAISNSITSLPGYSLKQRQYKRNREEPGEEFQFTVLFVNFLDQYRVKSEYRAYVIIRQNV